MRKGLGVLAGSLFGMATLITSMIIIIKKGPIAGAVILLIMAVIFFGVSVLSALVNWKKHKDG